MIRFESSGDHTLRISEIDGEIVQDLGLKEQGELREFTGKIGKLMKAFGLTTEIKEAGGKVHYVRKKDLQAYANALKFEYGGVVVNPRSDFVGGVVRLASEYRKGAHFLARKAARIRSELPEHRSRIAQLQEEGSLDSNDSLIQQYEKVAAAFEHISENTVDTLRNKADLKEALRTATESYLRVYLETADALQDYAALIVEVRGELKQLTNIAEHQIDIIADLRDYAIDDPGFKPTVDGIVRKFNEGYVDSILVNQPRLTGKETAGELRAIKAQLFVVKDLAHKCIREVRPEKLNDAEDPLEALYQIYVKSNIK